jgi:hypothetical protein
MEIVTQSAKTDKLTRTDFFERFFQPKNLIRAKIILSLNILDNVANKMVFLLSTLVFTYP